MVSSEQRSGTGTRTNKGCFHLAIEVLLISRLYQLHLAKLSLASGFNLAIEVLLIFKHDDGANSYLYVFQFQSRNREAFGFKNPKNLTSPTLMILCFHLGIERLFGSSQNSSPYDGHGPHMFPSRNREASVLKEPRRSSYGYRRFVSISESRDFSGQTR